MTDQFRTYFDLQIRHAAAIAPDSGLIPRHCCKCEPPIALDPAYLRKHNETHHTKAKRKKPKDRHQWRSPA